MNTDTLAQRLTGRLLPASRPGRVLAAGSFVDSLGSGLFLAVATLYFVGRVGIAPSGVALALAVAGCLGLVSGAPGGRLADRYGVGRVYVCLLLLRALSYGLYALVDGFAGYLAVTCLATVADRACSPLTQAAVRKVVGQRDRNRTMASIRALRNVGYTAGALVAAAAVAAHSTSLTRLMFVANGLTFLVTAWCAHRALGGTHGTAGPDPATSLTTSSATPRASSPTASSTTSSVPVPTDDGDATRADEVPPAAVTAPVPLRNPAFLMLTAGNALMCLHDTVLVVALPVWVVDHPAIPQGAMPVLLAVNTVLTVLVQMWVSALDMNRSRALRLLWTAAAALCATCLLLACAAGASTVLGTGLLVAAVVLLTLGENFHAASGWYLSDAMAPPSAYARYLGVFATGVTAHGLLGPALVLGALLPLGAGGWAVLGALFATGAGGMGLSAGRALPSVPRQAALSEASRTG